MYTVETTTTVKIMNIILTLKVSLCSPVMSPSSSFQTALYPRQPLTKFSSLYSSFHFLEFYINEIILYITFVRLLSFSIIISRFISGIACINSSFLLLCCIPLYGYTTGIFFNPFTCLWMFALFLVLGYYK